MTRAMAAHHGKENIRVNCVCPGMVFTPMVRGRGMTEEMRKARVGQNLMGQEGTAWDVGNAILFLCSKEARWVTGLIMPVDAGVCCSFLKRDIYFVLTCGRRPRQVRQASAQGRFVGGVNDGCPKQQALNSSCFISTCHLASSA